MGTIENRVDPAPKVGIVIPCYRSTGSLGRIAERTLQAMNREGIPFKIIFVDDGTPTPDTWSHLERVKQAYGDLVDCHRLVRNIGQHNAIMAGMEQLPVDCSIVVTMDDDLQHRPEDIPQLVKTVQGGAELAIGAYDTKKHAPWRNLGGRLIDATLRRIFSLPRSFQLTSFRGFRRFVADDVLEHRSRYTYLTAALLSVTRLRANVLVQHDPRSDGSSNYSLGRSLELAANLFLTYSRIPIYLVVGLLVVSILATASISIWVVAQYFLSPGQQSGWTSLMVMHGVTTSFNLAVLAIIALMTTRSHRQLLGAYKTWRVAETARANAP